jgi:hypothetical protein
MVEGMSSGEPNFLPYRFGNNACRCTFIDDTPMNCNVPYFHWDLESDQSGKARFSAVEIKCNESSICGVDFPQGGK